MKCSRFVCLFAVMAIGILPWVTGFLLLGSDSSNRNLTISKSDLALEARKNKKNNYNYLIGLVFGALLCKLVLFPVAVKAMAVMSSVSVLLSTLGLIISSIVGYAKVASPDKPREELIKVLHVNNPAWAKADLELPKGYIPPEPIDFENEEVETP